MKRFDITIGITDIVFGVGAILYGNAFNEGVPFFFGGILVILGIMLLSK